MCSLCSAAPAVASLFPIIPRDLRTCISRCINLMLAGLDEEHPRQAWPSPYSPVKATVISVSVKQFTCIKSGGLDPALAVPRVPASGGTCCSLQEWSVLAPAWSQAGPTGVGGTLWSLWLAVPLVKNDSLNHLVL